ncbi:MAG: hypothetical protein HXY36_04455 [Chloroflexi bacterium]|nr:hypothetical protein [Chloroflexota bacterium]
MPCRIGITTDPEGRREYWQKQAAGFDNWQILEIFRSRAAAKEYQTEYALRHGCEAALGDLDAPVTARELATEHDWWYVYHFDYVLKAD